jgi:hypothetical protein
MLLNLKITSTPMTSFWHDLYSRIVFYYTEDKRIQFIPAVYSLIAIPIAFREELSKKFRHLDPMYVKSGVRTLTVPEYVHLSKNHIFAAQYEEWKQNVSSETSSVDPKIG